MSWVTPEKALTYTGKDLDQAKLDLASFQISSYVGRLEEEPTDAISVVDRVWLAMATAYQAAWMKPGLLEHRESHKATSADGVAVTRESDSQIMLAPLASRCLRNLSWVGTRTTSQLSAAGPKGSMLNERADAYHLWTPLDIR